MSARKLRAVATPPPAPAAPAFTPVIWRCEVYPDYTLHLPHVGETVQFRAGSYTALSATVDEALVKLRGKKPIRRFNGVNIYRCGLCEFVSADEDEVNEHRTAAHDVSAIRATVED